MDKRENTIGARLNGEELELWDALMQRILKRNQLADKSKVLRDVLFGNIGIITEEDRVLLRSREVQTLLADEGTDPRFYMSQGNEKPLSPLSNTKASRDLEKARQAARRHKENLRKK